MAAHVGSIERVADFRRLLVKLEEAVGLAVSSGDAGVRRTQRWLGDEQPRAWAGRKANAVRAMEDAQATLRRKQLSPTPTGKPASVVAEQKAFRRAKQLVEECDRKLALTRAWARRFDRVDQDYRGGTGGVRSAAGGGIAESVKELDALLGHLEDYRRVAMPERPDAGGTP